MMTWCKTALPHFCWRLTRQTYPDERQADAEAAQCTFERRIHLRDVSNTTLREAGTSMARFAWSDTNHN